jgi:DNA-binding NarL/FixJ family response regulator
MTVSIVLADDHLVVREGLRRLLDEHFNVIGETGDGLEVPDLVERLKPQVLILDVMLPGMNGAEVARVVSKRSPDTAIVMLSMHADASYARDSLRKGAKGYVAKSAPPDELVAAVRAVAEGRTYLSSEVADQAALAYVEQGREEPPDAFDTLTTRERQVLQLLAEGMTYAEAAERLGVATRTVETHRANLARKLGLSKQTDLVRYAVRRGLVTV